MVMNTQPFRLLRKEDIAEFFDVCPRTLENWLQEGKVIAPKRIGGRAYWHPDVFYAWVDAYFSSADGTDIEMAVPPDSLNTREPLVCAEKREPQKRPSTPAKAGRDSLRKRDEAKLEALRADVERVPHPH